MAIDNDLVIKSISNCVYQALVIIKRDRPQWLKEQARDYAWEDPNFKTKFIDKSLSKLDRASDKDATISQLITWLQHLLSPPFFVSIHFTNLLEQIRQYIDPALEIEAQQFKHLSSSHKIEVNDREIDRIKDKQPFAMLLLDAENLTLDCKLEQILIGVCQYPLKIKFAFANWRSLGKKDWDLHSRGYELIHVPQGKNSADLKMIAFGSSLSLYYPQVKEVFICSSDTDLNPLSTKLQEDNLIVYRVYRRHDRVLIFNSNNQTTSSYSLNSVEQIPLLEELIAELKDIIRCEQENTKKNWIDLKNISGSFKSKYDLSLDRAIAHYFPEQKIKDFFDRFKNDFVVHQLGDRKIYVTIFEINLKEDIKNQEIKNQKEIEEDPIAPEIVDTPLTLELTLVRIIQNLSKRSKLEFIPISNVANEFKIIYNSSISKIIKGLNLSGNYTKLLQKSNRFKLKKVDNIYFVSVEKKKNM